MQWMSSQETNAPRKTLRYLPTPAATSSFSDLHPRGLEAHALRNQAALIRICSKSIPSLPTSPSGSSHQRKEKWKWTRSVVSLQLSWLFATPWTAAYQAPPSMEFSRQEYWSGLPFPSPVIFLTQGLNPYLPHCRQMLYSLSRQESPKVKVKVAQLCPTLCHPTDYPVYGILQVRILEWVAYLFSSGFFQPRNWTGVSCITDRFFINWAMREAPISLTKSP